MRDKKISFKQMANAELTLKMKGYKDSYDSIKKRIINDINTLEELDTLYMEANSVLSGRNTKGTNNFIKDNDENLWDKIDND